jgi:hypothetical protein
MLWGDDHDARDTLGAGLPHQMGYRDLDADDPLAPARGVLLGLALALPGWALAGLIWLVWRLAGGR